MPGSSPLRNGISLAQRFAYKPAEASTSSVSSSASKRRKLQETGSITSSGASISTSTSVAGGSGDASTLVSTTSTSTVVDSSEEAAAILADQDRLPDTSNKGKKRAHSPDTTVAPNLENLSNDVARSFADSLSEAELPGVGGSLSERQLLRLECETMHLSWLGALKQELRKPYFLKLKRFLWTEGVKSSKEASKTIFPPAQEIYSWSRFTPLEDVRVVILGQDPYHNDGQAHGLCFSVRSNVKTPPSLKNIYKEIKTDYPAFVAPPHGYLASWARQGVLLLNTCLTVRAHQANSHSKKGWEDLTDSILRVIDARPGSGVVFLAWGQPALKRMAKIDKKKHLVLSSAHPSPLSASRGFFGNQHFKKTNDWLREKYGEASVVDWTKLEAEKESETLKKPEKPVEVIGDKEVW